MNIPDNEKRICILAKQLSDFVGHAAGTEYFKSLLCAVNDHLKLPYGFVYSIDKNINARTLIATSLKHDTDYDILDILDSSIIELIINDSYSNVAIDLDNDIYISDIDNKLALNFLVSFPLCDSNNHITGLIIFASTEVNVEQNSVIDTIETQIPRAASEIENLLLYKRLKLYENNFNNLVSTSSDAIWEADLSGNISAINSSCKMLYGHSEKRMTGKYYTDFMTDESAQDFVEYLDQVAHGESLYNVVSDHITKDFDLIKVSYNIIPKYDEHNNISGIIGTTRDISASVRAQKTIRNNSELFSSILSRLPVIFFRVDEKGFLVDIRGNGLKRMGVEDMDWVGRPGYGLFIGMDAKIDSALSGNTVFFENKGTYQGTPWWFYTSMFFDSWSGYGAVGFSVDITEQKYVEEQLVELLNNNRKLAQKLVEIQEDERRNLARELHDELGQSITAVKSLATVISTSAGNQYSEIRSLANSIIDLSARLYEVVNSIMQRLRPDIIDGLDFNESITNCIVRSELETIGVNCRLNITGSINDLDEVVKVTIYRIVQECLTNISKHAMASNVNICIQRRTDDSNLRRKKVYDTNKRDALNIQSYNRDTVNIEISDDGIGMDIDEIMHARKQTIRHGLQGINERVTAMGGTLNISGKPGKGVSIQAVLILGGSHNDASEDINKCIADLKRMRFKEPDSNNMNTH